MTRVLLGLFMTMTAGVASAQVAYPGQLYVGDPIVDQHRHHLERQRQRSDAIADYGRQYRTNARLTQLELRARTQPEPYIPLVTVDPRDPDAAGQARERATTAREATVAGVTQIDDWLARGPR